MSDQNPPTPPPYGQQPPQLAKAPEAPNSQPQYGQPQYAQPQYAQPQYSQPQYGQQAPAAPYTDPYAAAQPQPPAARTNTLAIVALVLGLTVPIGGIVTGHIALNQIKRTGEAGHGLALAGLIIGYAYTILVILAIIAYVIFIVVIIGTGVASSGYSYNT